MRTALFISVLVALWLAYAASPFVGVCRLVEVVGQRDVLALPERVDFLALRGSPHRLPEPICALPARAATPFIKTVADAVAAPIVAELVSRSICLSSCKQAGQSTSCQIPTDARRAEPPIAREHLARVPQFGIGDRAASS
jgi:hypothetical protein